MGIPIFSDIIGAVKDVVSEVVVDKDKKREIDLELARLADEAEARVHQEVLAQIEVNKAEAGHGSIFVAGWRPFVGWVCGVGLAAQVALFPLLDRVFGWSMTFDTELLILTLGGMLGIGGMRTFEKVRGVSTNDYRDVPKQIQESPAVPDETPSQPTPKPKRKFRL